MGWAALFAAAAYCLGDRLLRRLPLASRAERLAMKTIVGLGALSATFFLAGCVKALAPLTVWLVLIACFALAGDRLRALLRKGGAVRLPQGPRPEAALLLGIGVVALPLLLAALYPTTDTDSTMYHLPAAAAFARTHGVGVLEGLRYPVFPQLAELLVAAMLLAGQDPLTPLLSPLWGLLVAVTLVAWASRLGDGRVGAWSGALWIGCPIVPLLAASHQVELCLAAFVTASLFALDVWRQTGLRGWLLVSGALAGWGAATKYTGLYFVVAVGLVVVLSRPRAGAARSLAAFLAMTLAAAGPWYARQAVLAGNPVWPFLGTLFGYRFWTPADVKSAIWTLRKLGGPHTPEAFLRMPWTLVSTRGVLSSVLFLLFPLGAAVGLLRPRLRWLAGLLLGYLGFWFLTTQQLRFLVVAIPAVAVVTSAGCLFLIDSAVGGRKSVPAVATALLVAATLGPRAWTAGRALSRHGLPPADAASRSRYLAQRLPSFPFYSELNTTRGSAYTVYALHDESMRYFCAGRFWGDWFGHGRYADMDLSSGASLYAGLKRLGAQYLLVNDAAIPTRLPGDPSFDEHFRRVFESGRVRAFELREKL